MKASRLYIATLFAVISWSCVETIDLYLPYKTERLVVFGWVTNQDTTYQVSVTKTNEFNSEEAYPVVTGASVYVIDRAGTHWDFIELPNMGIYNSPSGLMGVVNERYELHVETLEGNHIVSTQELLRPLPKIDTTFIEFVLDPTKVDLPPGQENWYFSGLIDDDADRENFYRWKIYINDTLRNDPEELVLFDDKFTNGNQFRFDASNVLFLESDKVVVESMSLSPSAYDFYRQLKNLSGSDFTGPVFQFSPLKGNLTDITKGEEVLGFFGASEIERRVVQP